MGFPRQVKPVVGFQRGDDLERSGMEINQYKISLTSTDLHGNDTNNDII